jgi:hypothetical protein
MRALPSECAAVFQPEAPFRGQVRLPHVASVAAEHACCGYSGAAVGFAQSPRTAQSAAGAPVARSERGQPD